MSNVLVVAEKPSVARDIARVLQASRPGDGYYSGNGYTVTWGIGHLVTLPEPHEIQSTWKAWRKENLPMLPLQWPLKVIEKTRSQFVIVKKLMATCTEIVCATDAGREGELIFRYLYEAAGARKSVKRLWISSLTEDAIRDGFKKLRDQSQYDSLADAARGRSRADWLIGMNLSRAYAIASGEQFFVGRVQTPTLAMIVQRDLEIQNFRPEDYFEITAQFAAASSGSNQPSSSNRPSKSTQHSSSIKESYSGNYMGEKKDLHARPVREKRLPPDLEQVQKIVKRIQSGRAQITSLESSDVRQSPPFLYDLTELQRHANRTYGYSASKTLEIAQALYERHKLISYPRTDCRVLSTSIAATLPKVVAAIEGPYYPLLKPTTGKTPLGRRFVNDADVSDHHAIIPTGVSPDRVSLNVDERRIFDLIARRLLSAWQGDYITGVTTVITEVSGVSDVSNVDVFRSVGTLIREKGWKVLDVGIGGKEGRTEETLLPNNLVQNLQVDILEVKPEKKKTKAPPSLTDSTVLTAMETAGKTLDDKELAAAMRHSGLGTPATRAGIIETLLNRGYIERRGKLLVSTEMGRKLIETVHLSVKSPELTARWEKDLSQIQEGKKGLDEFMKALEADLALRVQEVFETVTLQKTRSYSTRTHSTRSFRNSVKLTPEKSEKIASLILKTLARSGARPAGRLFEESTKEFAQLQRSEYEQVLKSLKEKDQIQVSEEKFEKGGELITYRKVSLPQKRATDASAPAENPIREP